MTQANLEEFARSKGIRKKIKDMNKMIISFYSYLGFGRTGSFYIPREIVRLVKSLNQ